MGYPRKRGLVICFRLRTRGQRLRECLQNTTLPAFTMPLGHFVVKALRKEIEGRKRSLPGHQVCFRSLCFSLALFDRVTACSGMLSYVA